MELIDRIYTDKVLSYLGKGIIIVLTGQRRVGKSCVLKCLERKIKALHPDTNIIYINKEYAEFNGIKNDEDLNQYLSGCLKDGERNCVLIDEVQDIEHFEKSLRSLQAKNECDIVVTGSNAKMLSSEISTYIAGRYIEIRIHGLSYPEFITFHRLADSDETLYKYLSYGGLPHLAAIGIENEDIIKDYLRDIYNTVAMKDIINRENIRNVRFLNDLIVFLADNTGKNISATNVSHYMKGQGQNISPAVIINYISYFINAYVINKVPRYDIHGKKIFESNEKYYFEDMGLKNSLVGLNLRRDIEKLMENAVYQHLQNKGYNVRVGQLQKAEIDFVASKGDERLYVQVSYLISNPETRKREFGNLININDNFPKYVVTMDPLADYGDYNGIKSMHLRTFLLS